MDGIVELESQKVMCSDDECFEREITPLVLRSFTNIQILPVSTIGRFICSSILSPFPCSEHKELFFTENWEQLSTLK